MTTCVRRLSGALRAPGRWMGGAAVFVLVLLWGAVGRPSEQMRIVPADALPGSERESEESPEDRPPSPFSADRLLEPPPPRGVRRRPFGPGDTPYRIRRPGFGDPLEAGPPVPFQENPADQERKGAERSRRSFVFPPEPFSPAPTDDPWEEAERSIRVGHYRWWQEQIDEELRLRPSLAGLMRVVEALEESDAPASVKDKYRSRADSLARILISQEVNDPLPWIVRAKFALQDGDKEAFRQAAAALVARFPDDRHAQYYASLLGIEQQGAAAEKELPRAQETEAQKRPVAPTPKPGPEPKPGTWKYPDWTVIVIGWLGGLVVLLATGMVLSWLTLRSIKSRLAREVTLGQRGIRWVYRWVINLTGIYYYLSLPVVIAIFAATTSGLICITLALSTPMERNAFAAWRPLTIALFLAMGLVAVWTSRVRMREGRIGRALEPDEAPRLFELARQVAEKVETRPLDEVRLVPSAGIAVVERGGFLARVFHRTRRVLILGVAALEGLTQGAFRALLAHEYGHFSNRDTAGGRVALRARLAMEQFLRRTQGLPGDERRDPIFRFFHLYYRLYCRLTLGASRLQEMLADRTAVTAYGPKAFEQGLMHVVRRSVEFDYALSRLRQQGVTAAAQETGLYDLMREFSPEDRMNIEAEVDHALHRPSTAYDSHPSPHERLAIIHGLDAVDPLPDERAVWELLPRAEQLEREMSAQGSTLRSELHQPLAARWLARSAVQAWAATGSDAVIAHHLSSVAPSGEPIRTAIKE